MSEADIPQKAPFKETVQQGNFSGAVAGNLRASHFATGRIKEAVLNL